MSGHNIPYEFPINRRIPDPGNAGTLGINENGIALCAIVSAGAETRTIPAPSIAGQQLLVYGDTLVGTVTVTVTSGVSGLTTVAFTTAGQVLHLEAITVAGTLKWQVMSSTPVGAALTTQLTAITFTAPGTPDYAIQDVINSNAYGFAAAEEARTFISVVSNLQTRMAELEARLQSAKIIA